MSDQAQLEDVIVLLEGHLSDGNFIFVDNWFDCADLDALSPTSIIGALSISYWGKDKLIRREFFLQRAEVVLKEKLGEERAEKLLFGRR
jgi:hypothetical protein